MRVFPCKKILKAVVVGAWLSTGAVRVQAQASALPSAQSAPVSDEGAHGRQLLDQMIAALGGQAWLSRSTERLEGRSATFYKGLPNPYEAQFEEYLRVAPFGERVVVVSKQGVFIPTTKRDVVEIWTTENGYEVSYHGRKELPKIDVEDFERRRLHSLDIVVLDWLKRPGTLVTFEGSNMDDRHLVDHVSILTPDNDAVTLGLDQETHLPRSRTFQWRNPIYKDLDTDLERYDDWQTKGGIMTPLTITRYHNGDMASQRFLTKVQYGLPLAPELFDPDHSLPKK
ncbi:MAG: hypothetical protein ACRYFU_24455 [Janthinobacterium lividum]